MNDNGLNINIYGNKYTQRRIAKECIELETQSLDEFQDLMKEFNEKVKEINRLQRTYTEEDPLIDYFNKAKKKEKQIKDLYSKINLDEADIEHPKLGLCIKIHEYDIIYKKIKGVGVNE